MRSWGPQGRSAAGGAWDRRRGEIPSRTAGPLVVRADVPAEVEAPAGEIEGAGFSMTLPNPASAPDWLAAVAEAEPCSAGAARGRVTPACPTHAQGAAFGADARADGQGAGRGGDVVGDDPRAPAGGGLDVQHGLAVLDAADGGAVDVAGEAAVEEVACAVGEGDHAVGEALCAERDRRAEAGLARGFEAERAGAGRGTACEGGAGACERRVGEGLPLGLGGGGGERADGDDGVAPVALVAGGVVLRAGAGPEAPGDAPAPRRRRDRRWRAPRLCCR